jgi:hypothetical protein
VEREKEKEKELGAPNYFKLLTELKNRLFKGRFSILLFHFFPSLSSLSLSLFYNLLFESSDSLLDLVLLPVTTTLATMSGEPSEAEKVCTVKTCLERMNSNYVRLFFFFAILP